MNLKQGKLGAILLILGFGGALSVLLLLSPSPRATLLLGASVACALIGAWIYGANSL